MVIFFSAVQMLCTLVMGIYFYRLLKKQEQSKAGVTISAQKELEDLNRLEAIHLTRPLTEQTRPTDFAEIIGQEDGVKALLAGLCGAHPQHIIIYGPCGVGKTAAARLALEAAKASPDTPFLKNAPFVELDATTLRYDERGIADPLMGSVHDPIYQGAGAYGTAGIPRPKAGAVTKAHGGVLFIDEIGEMPGSQLNKLLKVLEDRRVFLESAYYHAGDKAMPAYIKKIFENGLPADFRLVAATTRRPEELPPALRSRCMEIYFEPLKKPHLCKIAEDAFVKTGFGDSKALAAAVACYAKNGRDAVNFVQTAASTALLAHRSQITAQDVEWVAKCGRFTKLPEVTPKGAFRTGVVCAMAVSGSIGTLLELEGDVRGGTGRIYVSGMAEEEELKTQSSKLKRKSMAYASVQNAVAVLDSMGIADRSTHDFYVNFPGGAPMDGPSAGIAVFAALYSAARNLALPDTVALTGELSIHGRVLPVGGVYEKVEAAAMAGIKRCMVPRANADPALEVLSTEVVYIDRVEDVLLSLWGDIPCPAAAYTAMEGGI